MAFEASGMNPISMDSVRVPNLTHGNVASGMNPISSLQSQSWQCSLRDESNQLHEVSITCTSFKTNEWPL
eukprot:544386-Lingulodinium_polyedra.AAC.1